MLLYGKGSPTRIAASLKLVTLHLNHHNHVSCNHCTDRPPVLLRQHRMVSLVLEMEEGETTACLRKYAKTQKGTRQTRNTAPFSNCTRGTRQPTVLSLILGPSIERGIEESGFKSEVPVTWRGLCRGICLFVQGAILF
jgi:hypothetical protein